MPTPQTAPPDTRTPGQAVEAALARLRQGGNPFAFSVATAGTEESCAHYDVPELLDAQRSDLRAIVDLYRHPKQPSQAFPVLGDSGTGKTHLLNTFQAELQREAELQCSACLVVVADHFSAGLDAIDFFFWQIVNHLLARGGPGARTLRVVSDRLTARLLAEALRRLPPERRAALVPPRGLWDGLAVRLGLGSVGSRLDAVARLIDYCDGPAPTALDEACAVAGVPTENAVAAIDAHLEDTEPKDADGSLRSALYSRLARLALLGQHDQVEDYLTGEYLHGAAHVAGAGQVNRRLLTALLELFRALAVPVVLVFDQLEDFLVAPTEDRRVELRNAFGQAAGALINNVPGLCMLIFAERALWYETILAGLNNYARARLDQEFSLPGRASRRALSMPDQIGKQHLTRLIQCRVRPALEGLDVGALPPAFPFTEERLEQLEQETTIRGCLRRLSAWYNEEVFEQPARPQGTGGSGPPPPPPPSDEQVLAQLRARWQTSLASARHILQERGCCAALIPEVQMALDRWLSHLRDEQLTGSGPWAAVELLTDSAKGPYGYLSVVRLEQADSPGLGLAAWLGERRGRMEDLQHRLEFFDLPAHPIRTLVLFRRDGEDAIAGGTKVAYDEAMRKGRDVRVHRYEEGDLVSLLAFPLWLQAVTPDLEAAGAQRAAARREFVRTLSGQLLGWIDSWRQPRAEGPP